MEHTEKDTPCTSTITAIDGTNIDIESCSEDNMSDIMELGTSSESRQRVKQLLECPVCMELPLPPIYLCKRGHIVCNSCQDRTHYCPLCRDEYTNTRSFVAEGLIENFTLKCRYHEQGCPEVFKGSSLVGHLKVCDFRPVRCLYCQGEYTPYDTFFDHLLRKHNVGGVSKPEGAVKYSIPVHQISTTAAGIGKVCWAPSYFRCFGRTFMFHLHITGAVCGWLCLLDVEADCKKYEGSIQLKNNKFTLSWTGEINHFRADPLAICKTGKGLVLPFDVIRSNSVLNSTSNAIEWCYNIRIREAPVEPGLQEGAGETSKQSTSNLDEVPGTSKGSNSAGPDGGNGDGSCEADPEETRTAQRVDEYQDQEEELGDGSNELEEEEDEDELLNNDAAQEELADYLRNMALGSWYDNPPSRSRFEY